MPDLEKVLESIEQAARAVKQAQEGMTPITSIRQVEAYVMGHLRCASTILKDAGEAIRQSSALQTKRKQKKLEPPPEQP